MDRVDFLNLDQFYSSENLLKYRLSTEVIKEIQNLIEKEKQRLEKLDSKLQLVLNENNKEIFNGKLVKEFYIRNYRKFKFDIKSKAKSSFDIKYKKMRFTLDKLRNQFIEILLHVNYVDITQINDKLFSNVSVITELNKYFFEYIKLNELEQIVEYFQLQKIKSYRVSGKFFQSLYFKNKKDDIKQKEINTIKNDNGEMEIVKFYLYIIKMMKYLVYNYAFEKFKYFKIGYFFQYESCYVTWLFFEYVFGELVTSILYAFVFKHLTNVQIVGIYTNCLHRSIKLDDQFLGF